jgi:hypothetical protein
MERRIDKCLALCRDWAEGRVASGNEPPWAWYQYMKLIETVSAIQTGRRAVSSESPGVRPPASRSSSKTDGVSEIGVRRRRRDDEDDEPPLPM